MPLRYIIIEDSLFVRELLKNTVSSFGLKLVGESDNVDEAIDLIENYRPHLAIVDLVLPQKNGFELIKEIRNSFPEMEIVACSTLIEPDIQKKVFNSGCHYFLKKPFTRESVGDVIKNVLSKKVKKEGVLG